MLRQNDKKHALMQERLRKAKESISLVKTKLQAKKDKLNAELHAATDRMYSEKKKR